MACLSVLGFCETVKKWARYAFPSIDHEIPSAVSSWTASLAFVRPFSMFLSFSSWDVWDEDVDCCCRRTMDRERRLTLLVC